MDLKTYEYIAHDNGNILLKKIILDYNNYVIKTHKNGNILLKKRQKIYLSSIDEILEYNFSNSNILECIISIDNKQLKFNKLTYKCILNSIFIHINDGKDIINNSILNIKTIPKYDEGFYYIKSLGISIQRADLNTWIKEMLTQCYYNNLKTYMEINLKSKKKLIIDIN